MAEEKKPAASERRYGKKPSGQDKAGEGGSRKPAGKADHKGEKKEEHSGGEGSEKEHAPTMHEKHHSERTAMHKKHEKERSTMHGEHREMMRGMHDRQEGEFKDMHARHASEMESEMGADNGDQDGMGAAVQQPGEGQAAA